MPSPKSYMADKVGKLNFTREQKFYLQTNLRRQFECSLSLYKHLLNTLFMSGTGLGSREIVNKKVLCSGSYILM